MRESGHGGVDPQGGCEEEQLIFGVCGGYQMMGETFKRSVTEWKLAETDERYGPSSDGYRFCKEKDQNQSGRHLSTS